MKFCRIIGEVDSDKKIQLVNDCQSYLSDVFAELSTGWNVNIFGSKIGGDPLLMQLVGAMPHYCDLTGYNFIPLKRAYEKICRKQEMFVPLNEEDEEVIIKVKEYKNKYKHIIDTAATDGNNFYWAPHFVLSKSKVGVRLLIGHEGVHASLLHPSRMGHRISSLWGISIDFKSNFNVIDDLRSRKIKHPEEMFKELSDFVNLEDYAAFIRDPYSPPDKMSPFSPKAVMKRMLLPNYIDNDHKDPTVLFAEPNLKKELIQPESIYDYLLGQVPRCLKCGRMFCYKVPDDVKEMKLEIKKIQNENKKKYGTNKKMHM